MPPIADIQTDAETRMENPLTSTVVASGKLVETGNGSAELLKQYLKTKHYRIFRPVIIRSHAVEKVLKCFF